MTVLITGAAGFIGFHTAMRCLREGHHVAWVDNLNSYYDVSLKEARLSILKRQPGFEFELADLADRAAMERVFLRYAPEVVIHLGAQAGVRYSLETPHVYVASNLTGFLHVLEGCRHGNVEHLLYASSSSVYGANTKLPFSEGSDADHPVSLYAATKRANELMAHVYSHVYRIPSTGVRFFTVYGPWGRPDMAPFLFTQAILAGQPIRVFNHGRTKRDFTYVDDVVEAVLRLAHRPPSGPHPCKVYNVGHQHPVEVLRFIQILEDTLGVRSEKLMLPLQAGDMAETFANVDELICDTGFEPSTPIETGLARFVEWYRAYYQPDSKARDFETPAILPAQIEHAGFSGNTNSLAI